MFTVTPGMMKRIFSTKCGSARANLRPLRSSQTVLPSGPLVHLLTIATEHLTSQVRTGCPPGNSCTKRLTKQAKFFLTAICRIFHSTLYQHVAFASRTVSALSSILTFTPANLNAVAANSFRTKAFLTRNAFPQSAGKTVSQPQRVRSCVDRRALPKSMTLNHTNRFTASPRMFPDPGTELMQLAATSRDVMTSTQAEPRLVQWIRICADVHKKATHFSA